MSSAPPESKGLDLLKKECKEIVIVAPNRLKDAQVTPLRQAKGSIINDEEFTGADSSLYSPDSAPGSASRSTPISRNLSPVPSSARVLVAGEDEEELLSQPNFSESLKSPITEGQFSPSSDLKGPGNLHGLGLMLAVDRSKKLSKCGRRVANLLYDVAGVYDAYSQSILKLCSSAGSLTTATPVQALINNAVNKSLVSFAKQIQGLVICIRGSVARPLHGSMGSMGETASNISNRYTKTRFKSYNARKNAVQMRMRYQKAVREADLAVQGLAQVKEMGETNQQAAPTEKLDTALNDAAGSNSSNEFFDQNKRASLVWGKSLQKLGIKQESSEGTATDQVIRLLNEVQTYEAHYRQLVEKEKQAVSQSQMMEGMALEAIQELEDERLHFFLESMGRILQTEKGALDNMVLSLSEDNDDYTEMVSREEKGKLKGNVFTSLLSMPSLPSSSQYVEGVGLMEADTLGLPEEVGKIRDDVRSRLEARETRVQVVRALSSFMEEIAIATSVLGNGIKVRLGQDGYGDTKLNIGADSLLVALEKYEGPRVVGFWSSIIRTIDEGAKSALEMTDTIRNLRQQKLDTFILRASKDVKRAADNDDTRWKHLCEATRVENKADNRYRQTSSQFEKARDRVKSVDSGSEHGVTVTSQLKMKPGMSKALGSMMSILPNGGEHALKIMTPSARRAIAQTTFEEADQNKTKNKESLDVATEVKSQAINVYISEAQTMLLHFKKDDDEGWDDCRVSIKLLVSAFDVFCKKRKLSIEQPTAKIQQTGNASRLKDMLEWIERVQNHMQKKAEEAGKHNESVGTTQVGKFSVSLTPGAYEEPTGLGFTLEVVLEESKRVYDLLASVNEEDEELEISDRGDKEMSDLSTKGASLSSDKSESPIPGETTEGLVVEKVVMPSPPGVFRKAFTDVLSPNSEKLKNLAETLKDYGMGEGNEKVAVRSRSDAAIPDAAKELAYSPVMEVFLTHFWSDRDEGNAPTVIDSFSCAYWPKGEEGSISPLLHGRLFVTSETIYFVGWGEKKIVLDWKNAVNVSKEKNMMGTIDNSLCITYNCDEGESSYFFGSFSAREDAYQLTNRLVAVAKALDQMETNEQPGEVSLPDVPPDQAINGKMDLLLSKTIKNTTIEQFYEIVWSEGNRTDKDPFYGPFLEYMGSNNLKVGEWEFSEDRNNLFVNKWCGEKFQQRRVIDFEFTRKTHLYVGPPIAVVKQTQHCRVEGNDRCVLAMTVEMSGIPYSDCFAVEVRWVARRIRSSDICVEVGVFVDFKKSTIFAKQIKSGTITETKPIYFQLFDRAKKACLVSAGNEGTVEVMEKEEEEEVIEKEKFNFSYNYAKRKVESLLQNPPDNAKLLASAAVVGISLCLRYALGFGGSLRSEYVLTEIGQVEELGQQVEALTAEIHHIGATLDDILAVIKESYVSKEC